MSHPNPSFNSELFEALPIVGILRGIQMDCLKPLIEACLEGGLLNLEITMNTPGAHEMVRKAIDWTQGRMNIGTGTVLTQEDVRIAAEAGTQFIVTPITDISIIRTCKDRGIPVFPGAMTPGEVALCWQEGAAGVKIFPAEHLGPEYIKALKGPFPGIKLMPTGGVTPSKIKPYAQAGASAFGVGSPLFPKSKLAEADWESVTANCRCFKQAWQNAKG